MVGLLLFVHPRYDFFLAPSHPLSFCLLDVVVVSLFNPNSVRLLAVDQRSETGTWTVKLAIKEWGFIA